MLDMFQTDFQKSLNMVIVQGVVHHPTILALLYQSEGAQDSKVLRYC